MNKLTSFLAINFLLASSAFATINPEVPLPGGGDVAPTTQMAIPLTGLIASATYSVVCYIDTTTPFMIVRFGSSFSDTTSTVTSYTLNGDTVTQGQLTVGHNVAVIVGNFTNPSTASVTFTNLDQNNTFNVNNCYATPVIG